MALILNSPLVKSAENCQSALYLEKTQKLIEIANFGDPRFSDLKHLVDSTFKNVNIFNLHIKDGVKGLLTQGNGSLILPTSSQIDQRNAELLSTKIIERNLNRQFVYSSASTGYINIGEFNALINMAFAVQEAINAFADDLEFPKLEVYTITLLTGRPTVNWHHDADGDIKLLMTLSGSGTQYYPSSVFMAPNGNTCNNCKSVTTQDSLIFTGLGAKGINFEHISPVLHRSPQMESNSMNRVLIQINFRQLK
ncbi:MAG: DUF1826 domain-containing protein [Bdellovibrionales bacterium]|nr:DUF1826 domain-containing protein [Bdellovibrionales bacterium]